MTALAIVGGVVGYVVIGIGTFACAPADWASSEFPTLGLAAVFWPITHALTLPCMAAEALRAARIEWSERRARTKLWCGPEVKLTSLVDDYRAGRCPACGRVEVRS